MERRQDSLKNANSEAGQRKHRMRLEYCVAPTSEKVLKNQQGDVKKMQQSSLTGYIWDNFKISKELMITKV